MSIHFWIIIPQICKLFAMVLTLVRGPGQPPAFSLDKISESLKSVSHWVSFTFLITYARKEMVNFDWSCGRSALSFDRGRTSVVAAGHNPRTNVKALAILDLHIPRKIISKWIDRWEKGLPRLLLPAVASNWASAARSWTGQPARLWLYTCL